MHIKFSEKFASDITSLNEQLKGKTSANPLDFISKAFKDFSDSSETPFTKEAYANFANNLEVAAKTLDANVKTHLQFVAIKTFLNEAFPENGYLDTTSEKLKLLYLSQYLLHLEIKNMVLNSMRNVKIWHILPYWVEFIQNYRTVLMMKKLLKNILTV